MAKANSQATDTDLLSSINDKLACLLAIAALTYTAGKNRQAAIEGLGAAGLPAKAISDMTGWPMTSVAPILSRSKSKLSARSKKPRVKAAKTHGDRS